MDFLCKVCDRAIFENESGYKDYPATLRKENDKNLYKKHSFYNIILGEVDKILNDYVTIHNKNFLFI